MNQDFAGTPRGLTAVPLGDLIDKSRSGDRAAADQLARWCLPRVRRTVLLSCGGGPDVDDLVQTVMAKVLTRLDTFRGEAGFFMWVDRITINAVRDHYRRQSRGVFMLYNDEWEEHQVQPTPRPDRDVDRQRLMERLSYHLDKLKPAQRLPLVLHLLHGYTVPEVAAMLELSFEATKKRLLRGRRMLMDRLTKDPQCREILGEMGR